MDLYLCEGDHDGVTCGRMLTAPGARCRECRAKMMRYRGSNNPGYLRHGKTKAQLLEELDGYGSFPLSRYAMTGNGDPTKNAWHLLTGRLSPRERRAQPVDANMPPRVEQ